MIEFGRFDLLHDEADSSIGATPLTASSRAKLLKRLVTHAEHQQFVFDLDSTLLNNRPRNAVIMQEFGKDKNEALLTQATADHFQDWSLRNALNRLGMASDAVERLISPLQDFWYERFFSSDYCQYDITVLGAPEFVNAVIDAGGSVTYLTGRHEAMRMGTALSLSKLGFPSPDDDCVRLLMKPELKASDDLFKVETLRQLKADGAVFAAFDNEPTHINSYRSAFPSAVCVHLLTDHSMREVKLLDRVVSIHNFVI